MTNKPELTDEVEHLIDAVGQWQNDYDSKFDSAQYEFLEGLRWRYASYRNAARLIALNRWHGRASVVLMLGTK